MIVVEGSAQLPRASSGLQDGGGGFPICSEAETTHHLRTTSYFEGPSYENASDMISALENTQYVWRWRRLSHRRPNSNSSAALKSRSRHRQQLQECKEQIEYFGQEVDILGNILEQLERFYSMEDLQCDEGVYAVTRTILDQCTTLFRELDECKRALCTQSGRCGISPLASGYSTPTSWMCTVLESRARRRICSS